MRRVCVTSAEENMFPMISGVLKLPRLGVESSDSGRPLIDPRLPPPPFADHSEANCCQGSGG